MSPLIHPERDPNLYCPPVVQVPEGMTADEARQILTDARPWVPWVEGTKIGARIRVDTPGGLRLDGHLRSVYSRDSGHLAVSLLDLPATFSAKWVTVHPDDVPSRDRDADLIDDLATALRKAWDANAGLARYPVSDPVWGDLARVAIERVRAGA